jgi:hypothetical protein
VHVRQLPELVVSGTDGVKRSEGGVASKGGV